MTSPTSLEHLLRAEGSDKWKYYGEFYDFALSERRHLVRSVLEIGIGTMLPGAPSSMPDCAGPGYRPGGSLRAWRNFFPNAIVYGIDVQSDTQFSNEERVSTYICDSADLGTFEQTVRPLVRLPFDVVIDDGLHEPDHQIKTFRNFFPLLRPFGLYVMEDILPEALSRIMGGVADMAPSAPRVVIHPHRSEYHPLCLAFAVRSLG